MIGVLSRNVSTWCLSSSIHVNVAYNKTRSHAETEWDTSARTNRQDLTKRGRTTLAAYIVSLANPYLGRHLIFQTSKGPPVTSSAPRLKRVS